MPWQLIVAPRAEKDLADLPLRDRQAMGRALDSLTRDPAAVDLRKLEGRPGHWRLRVGRWRAVLRLDNAAGAVYVLRVLARDRAYPD